MTTSSDPISIDTTNLSAVAARFPSDNFSDSKFDYDGNNILTDILFIYSTPRSGSTFLSDIIRRNGICLPHEYFQAFAHLPILADRWKCVKNGLLDKSAYISNLIRHRTSPKGWLGINLHGGHLKLFSKVEQYLPNATTHHVYLLRKDIFAQAVSYTIASQTGRWSSHFRNSKQASYSFSEIVDHLYSIHNQNSMVLAFTKSHNISCHFVYYEDLIENTQSILGSILPKTLSNSLMFDSSLKKQASTLNQSWIQRFSEEFFETEGAGFSRKQPNQISPRVKKVFDTLFNFRQSR